MAPRAIWRGIITFGMVSIPVKLYAATESKDVSFNQLHRECNSRIKQKRWCPVCEREVERDEIIKGYEYAKDKYVILTDEDLDRLPVASRHTIQLSAFVEQKHIDPVYHEKSYFLEPDETGVKPYTLLMRALDSKGLSGVANIAIRNRERLCALRPVDGALMLDTLYYADEIRQDSRPNLPDILVSKRELDMANSLIDMLSEQFEPEQYQDQYRTVMMELIQAKLQGQEIVEPAIAEAPKVTDLMAALKASVEAAKKKQSGKTAPPSGGKRRKASAA